MAMTVALHRFNERPALLEREDFGRLAHRSGQDFRTCFERTHQVGAQFLKGLPIVQSVHRHDILWRDSRCLVTKYELIQSESNKAR